MAGNLQQYSLSYFRVGSALLAEETSITIERMSGAQIVLTVLKGFAGMSPGAQMVRGRVSNAIPAAGHEMNAANFIKGVTPIEMGVRLTNGTEATINGYITSDALSHSVNQESRYDFEYVGQFTDFV